MDFASTLIVAIIFAVLGAISGAAAVGASWESDCQRLGMTQSGGKVYECRLKP